jgi:hypothetical protein
MLRNEYNDLGYQSRNSMIGINCFNLYFVIYTTCFDPYRPLDRKHAGRAQDFNQ